MKTFKLYVDELGNSHPANYKMSPYYVLIGCIIEELNQNDLKVHADQIKFKYWGRTNIVFHSAEIAKEINDFVIFAGNPALKVAFLDDLFHMLQAAPLRMVVCLVDKKFATAKRWDEKKVVKVTAQRIIGDFIAILYTHLPCTGKLIFEASNGFKDQEYLASFNYYLSPNFSKSDPDFSNVREHVTSINFVTKQNYDTETQVSDLLAYAARCKYERDNGIKDPIKGSYEDKMIAILESKLITAPSSIGAAKKLYYDKIDSFCTINK